MKLETPKSATETVKLSPTEQKLLQQIQAQAPVQAPAQPSLVKFLSSTTFGFSGW